MRIEGYITRTGAAGRAITAPMHIEVISKKPAGNPRQTPLLFIHGAWHGAWCWEQFQSYFAEQGYASHALNLRGHGRSEGRDRLRWLRAADYVADVAHVVERLPRPPVLIAHSAGCYLLQKYLESYSAPGAVLLATTAVSGTLKMFFRIGVRHPWQTVKAHLTMNPYAFIETPKLAREYLFSADISPDRLSHYFALLQSESYLYGWDSICFNLPRPERARKAPMLVLGAGDDKVIPCEEVAETAAAYNVQAEFFPDMAHDMMLEKDWMNVADRILEWLREHDLHGSDPG